MANTTPVFEWDYLTVVSKIRIGSAMTSLEEAPVLYSLQHSLDSSFVNQVTQVDSIVNARYAVPELQPLDSCHNYYYWRVQSRDLAGNESGYQDSSFRFLIYDPAMIDPNCEISVTDVVYLINYLFRNGPDPGFALAGDVDCSGEAQLSDVVYLINYLFKDGPPPCKP